MMVDAVHFCSDAANEAMDEWKTGTGVNTTARNTEPQNKSLHIADHCTRQSKVLSVVLIIAVRRFQPDTSPWDSHPNIHREIIRLAI